ncbi:MAG: OmpA family protein [Polyangiaceae bacterium]|nr:OmpA family protein [Polyangiaceae bacterium]
MIRKACFVALSGVIALGGCTASLQAGAQGNAGGNEPPPPPPPPPAASSAAPAPAPTAPAPEEKKPMKSTATVKGDSVNIPGNIVFDTGKATLKEGAGSEAVLEQLKIFLDENPRVTKLRIEGHTDNVGVPADNVTLSGQRALTIKNWLVAKGIPKERLIAVGFGQDKPIADNATDAGRAQNRRTEFKIAEISGKPYLGQDPNGGGKVFE